MSIQTEYGEFDSRFLGVDLRFNASHPHILDLFDEIGSVRRDPANVLKIGDAALASSPERAFEVFSVGTVLTHELRHFHDFLLTPYGNALFRLHLTIMMNGFQVLPIVRSSKTIPVPFGKWLSKTAAEKASLIQMWQQLKPLEPVSKFDMPQEHRELVNQTKKTYDRIRDFLVNPKTISATATFQPYHLFEASAFITQIQAVYSVFGQKHVELFMNFVLNHPSAKSYSTVVRLLYAMWGDGAPNDAETMNAVVTWCLLGDYLNDGWKACPTVRFMRLFEVIQQEGIPNGRDVGVLFDEWTERFSYSPIETAMTRNQAANQTMIKHLEANWSAYPQFMHESLARALQGLKALAQANRHMADVLLANPKAYVNAYDYIQNDDLWPAASQTTSFVSGGLKVTKEKAEDLSQRGIVIHKARESVDGKHLLILKTMAPNNTAGVEMIDGQVALDIADDLTMTDFFFSEFRRGDPAFDVVRFVLEEEGVTPMEILM